MNGTNGDREPIEIAATERDRRDGSRLRIAVRRHLNKHREESVIDPYKIANDVLEELTPQEIRIAAHLQLRSISRELLRREYELATNGNGNGGIDKPTDHSDVPSSEKKVVVLRRKPQVQPEIPNLLQDRYPQFNHEGYIKREDMSEEDWRYNVDRLKQEVSVKSEHADQLQTWGEARGWKYEAA